MIDIITDDLGLCGFVTCDACGAAVGNAIEAVALRGPGGRAVVAHKGLCHEIAERRLSTAGRRFIELAELLDHVIVATGMNAAAIGPAQVDDASR